MTDRIRSFEDFLSDNVKGEIVDYNNPNCISCNDCCSLATVITKKEYNRIKKYLTTDVNGIALYKQGKELIKRYRKDGIIYFKCPLSLEYSKKCGIYKIRPQICRDFHCKSELNKVKQRPKYGEHEYTIFDLFDNKKNKTR